MSCGFGRTGQYLRDVLDAHGAALAVQSAGDVHQAADVSRHDSVGAAALDAGNLPRQQAAGNLAHFHGEEAPEAAASGLLVEVASLHAQAAQAVTGRVVRNALVPGRPHVADAEHVDEERSELVRARGKLSRTF